MKSKAYCFANASDYDADDISKEITFAETPGKAKQDFSIENGIHYKDIRVQRLHWADKYESVDNIPVEELLNHGWCYRCNGCGAWIEDISNYYINNKECYCKECFDELENRR